MASQLNPRLRFALPGGRAAPFALFLGVSRAARTGVSLRRCSGGAGSGACPVSAAPTALSRVVGLAGRLSPVRAGPAGCWRGCCPPGGGAGGCLARSSFGGGRWSLPCALPLALCPARYLNISSGGGALLWLVPCARCGVSVPLSAFRGRTWTSAAVLGGGAGWWSWLR